MSPKVSEQKRINQILAALVVILALALGITLGQQNNWLKLPVTQKSADLVSQRQYAAEAIKLPPPQKTSRTSVEQALQSRRSRRTYQEKSLDLNQLSQLLWSAQGITTTWGGRTTPSAKSAYPLEITVVAKNIEDLEPGIYHYLPENHEIRLTLDQIPEKYDEAAQQQSGQAAPLALIISANFQRMTDAFEGQPSDANVYLEAGHAAQNVYLQAESLKLGTVVVGGFNQSLMQSILQIPSSEQLIYLIPVGYPSEQ